MENPKMKIAVATEDGRTIAHHLGRSPFFAIVEVEDRTIRAQSLRPNTFTQHARGGGEHLGEHSHHGHGDPNHHAGLAEGLNDCAVVISHGMGRRAWEDLSSHGLKPIVTNETDVRTAVELYLDGRLTDQVHKLH